MLPRKTVTLPFEPQIGGYDTQGWEGGKPGGSEEEPFHGLRQEEYWPTSAREKAGKDRSRIQDLQTFWTVRGALGSSRPLKGVDTLEDIRFTSIRQNMGALVEQERLLPSLLAKDPERRKTQV